MENTKYEQIGTDTKLHLTSNNNMLSLLNRVNNDYFKREKGILITNDRQEDTKILRDDKKKITISEFQQPKITSYKKDNDTNLKYKNNLVLYSNSNNKNTNYNTISSQCHIRKDLFFENENNNFNSNSLDLEVINSWNLPKGLKLHINEDHLDNSLRNKHDGKIYFGFQKDINSSNKKPYIDYLILPKDEDYDDKFIGIHFQLSYDKNNFKYYIKDLGYGYGTFIKLRGAIKIKNNLLVNIGESFIVFTCNENNEKNFNLILKIFTGDGKSEVFEFNPGKKTIIIGRDISSDVYIEDKMLSRKHCYIYYEMNEEEKGNWFIKDGDLDGKKSTNETWIYSSEDTLIYDQMIFKTNHNLFKCNFS